MVEHGKLCKLPRALFHHSKSLHGIIYEIYHCNMGIQRHFTYIVELKDIFYDRIDQYIVLEMAMFCCIIELEKKIRFM